MTVVIAVGLVVLVFVVGATARALILAWTRPHRHAADPELRQPSEADVDAFLEELPPWEANTRPAPGKTIYTDHSVRLPWTPQVWKSSRTLTDAEMAEIRERFVAAQGGPVQVLDEDDAFDLCAGCASGSDHCDGAVEFCCCTCGWDEDWADDDELDEPGVDVDADVEEWQNILADEPVAENLCHCGKPAGHVLAALAGDHPEAALDTGQFEAVR